MRFRHHVYHCNISTSGNPQLSYINTLRVKGNISGSARLIFNSATNVVKFIEVLGTVSTVNTSGTDICFHVDNNARLSSCLLHLGYDGVACSPVMAGANYSNLVKIYVGDGSSQEHDQAILDQYLADSAWAAYASKLDLWYNYDGEYKESPFDEQ